MLYSQNDENNLMCKQIHGKNAFIEVSKNLAKYKSKNNFN